jgi:hypothetical protein
MCFQNNGTKRAREIQGPKAPRPCAGQTHRDTRYTEDQFVLLGLDDALWLRGRPSPRAKETRRLPRLLGRCREVIWRDFGRFLDLFVAKKSSKDVQAIIATSKI